MVVYFLLFIYLLLLKLLVNPQKRKSVCVLAGFGLWVVLALRSPYCGIDLMSGASGSANYYNMFEKTIDASIIQILDGDLTRVSNMERGWLLYCKLVSLFSTQFQVFLAITALVQLSLIGFVFYRLSFDIILSFITYFCFGLFVVSFSAIRQSTAFAISFLSAFFILRKQYRLFFSTVLLASSIHSSALIFLLAYPLNRIRFNSVMSRIFICSFFVFLPFLSVIVKIVVPFIFGTRYQNYQDSGGAISLFILYVILFVMALKISNLSTRDNLLRCMIALAVICQSLGYIGAGAITRIGFYFSIFFTLIFPDLVAAYSTRSNRTVVFFMSSLLLLGFFYLTTKDGYLDVVPYHFFWQIPY